MLDIVALCTKTHHKVNFCRVKISSLLFLSIFIFALSSFSTTVLAQGQGASITVTGEASVEITDYFETGKFTLRYFIFDRQSGVRTEVFIPGLANGSVRKDFRTGNFISVQGSRRPNGRDIDFQGLELLEAHTDNAPAVSAAVADAEAPAAPPVTREILTLLVDFNDAVVYDYTTPANTPNGATLQDVKDRMFNETKNVAHFYNTASLGTLIIPSSAPTIPGEIPVYGPYKIDLNYLNTNPGSCSSSTYVNAALDKWEAATGQSRSSYKHHSLILPNYWDYGNAHCTFGGQAQLGCGNNCWAVSRDPISILHGVLIHELGHNFNMNHARTDTNNDGSTDSEYGDRSDLMGSSRNWMKFNPPHIEYKGWHDPVSYELRTITPTSTIQEFQLIPVDEEDTEWPGLRALKTTRTASTNYYLSYRQRTGHYNNVTSSYTTGVSLHWRSSSSYSYFYRIIEAGEVFVDASADLLVYAIGATTIDNPSETDTTEAFTLRVCNTTCATLLPPMNLSAAGSTPNSIELRWVDYTYNEDGFSIEYSVDGSSWSTLGTAAANATSYLHSGLSGDSTFFYRVQAYRVSETSDWSNTANASTPPASGSFGFRIQTGDDDVEEFDSNGAMWLTSSYINLGLDSGNGAHDEGLRFQGVAVPQGATINSAYIEYRAAGSGTGASSVTYRTEDVDDGAAFTSATNNLTSRSFGGASVAWVLSDWSNGSYYQSPDLTSIVQPIIDKVGWSGGNSMVFVSQGTQTGSQRGWSYNGSSANAPLLVIDYTWIPAGNEPPTAAFTYSCTILDCNFTDTSTDADGSIVSWSWDFDDSSTSAAQNPAHSFVTFGSYNVSLTVTDNEGTTDNIGMNVDVVEPASYSVGGNVNGLTGTGLVLQNNAGNSLPIAVDGGFTFSTSLYDGTSYTVSVMSQPTNPIQVCSVSNGSGTLAGTNVSNVAISCTTYCNVNMTSDAGVSPDDTYEACEILVVGPDFTVENGSSAFLSGGVEIWFEPGFIVEQGATLSADVCGQSLCEISSSPMPDGCHSCVVQICDIDPACCDTAFDLSCRDKVDTVCGLVCE